METTTIKPKRQKTGGRIKGTAKKTTKHYLIDNDLLPELHSQKNMNQFVNQAIRTALTNLKEL